MILCRSGQVSLWRNNTESGRKAKTASGMVGEGAEKPEEDNCLAAVDASIPAILLGNNAREALIGRRERAASWEEIQGL